MTYKVYKKVINNQDDANELALDLSNSELEGYTVMFSQASGRLDHHVSVILHRPN